MGQSLSGQASKFNLRYVEFGLMNNDFFGTPGLLPLVLAVTAALGVELPILLLAMMCAWYVWPHVKPCRRGQGKLFLKLLTRTQGQLTFR
jgi:hypothetical protein